MNMEILSRYAHRLCLGCGGGGGVRGFCEPGTYVVVLVVVVDEMTLCRRCGCVPADDEVVVAVGVVVRRPDWSV